MPNTRTKTKNELVDRVDELDDMLEQIADEADDALGPECTREELVGSARRTFSTEMGAGSMRTGSIRLH